MRYLMYKSFDFKVDIFKKILFIHNNGNHKILELIFIKKKNSFEKLEN